MTTPPPGPDAWKPPGAPVAGPQAPSLASAFAFPGPPPPDPRLARASLARTAPRLALWLRVGQVALLVFGVLGALGLFLGGLALLRLLPGLLGVDLPAALPWLLGLVVLLTLVSPVINALLLGWARELIGRLAAWALKTESLETRLPETGLPEDGLPETGLHETGLSVAGVPAGGAPGSAAEVGSPVQARGPYAAPADLARMEQLRRTLSGWLTFGQWGALVGTLLGSVFTAVLIHFGVSALNQLGASADDAANLTPALEGFQDVSNLAFSLPGVVIVWLILGAVKRFMNLAAARAAGGAAPLQPAARPLGTWFILVIVLLGLSLLNLLVSGGLVVIFGGIFSSTLTPDALPQLGIGTQFLPLLSSTLGWLLPTLAGVLVLTALFLILELALIALSRGYALSLAALLDAPPAAAPAAVPAAALPQPPAAP